jgi:mannose-6-phosphate isomerase-like protein (cupin superfamily)
MLIVKKDTLPTVRLNGEVAAHIFDGSDHGNISSSAFIVDCAPGTGPRRHKHPYDEVFIIVEGNVQLEADGELFEATPQDICIVPTDVPHTFTNLGPGRALMVNVHANAKAITEFVDDGASSTSYEYNHTT